MTAVGARGRWIEPLKWAASLLGWAIGLASLWLIREGRLLEPGIDLGAYLRAGEDLLHGRSVYVGQIGDPTNFPYAPTWAVISALATIPPPEVVQVAMYALDLVAIRYVAGSWRAAGYVMAWPLTAFVMSAGNIDLLIAGAIVLAWREGVARDGAPVRAEAIARVAPLVLMALAKLAPALALPPRRVSQALLVAVACFLVTLPWLHLWPEWVGYLVRQPAQIAISIPIPWFVRVPAALALIALVRRPWAAALAVVVAMPSLYLSTSVILIAAIRLYLDERRELPRSASDAGRVSPDRPGP